MNKSTPELWERAGASALLAFVFLAPLVFHLRTYDSALIKTTVLQVAALALLAAWTLKGLTRGRWEAATASGAPLLALAALVAWTAGRFLTAPFKLGVLPQLVLSLSAWLIYAWSVLEFGGARQASRAAGWLTAAALGVAAYGVAQRLGLDPLVWKDAFGAGVVFSSIANNSHLGQFAAISLPVVLAAWLDPESSAPRRWVSAGAALGLALMAAWCASTRAQLAFALSAGVFAAAALAILRGAPARQAAGLALGAAALAFALSPSTPAPFDESFARSKLHWGAAMELWRRHPVVGAGPGSFFIHYPNVRAPEAAALDSGRAWVPEDADSMLLQALAETGFVGAMLLLAVLVSALLAGLNAAIELRRRGALAEAGYAAAFAAAFGAWALSAQLGLASAWGSPAWLAWPLAGIAAGMGALARPRGTMAVLPLPYGEDVRRLLHAPVLGLLAFALVWPGKWVASDVDFNKAVFYAKYGHPHEAERLFASVAPGSPRYALSLYFRGNALLDGGSPREALAVYARLGSVAPDYARVHARKAEAHGALREWPESAREWARQAELDPLNVKDLVAWAEAARAAGDLEQAWVAASRAEALAPQNPLVRTALAANELLERRLARKDARGGRAVAKTPKRR